MRWGHGPIICFDKSILAFLISCLETLAQSLPMKSLTVYIYSLINYNFYTKRKTTCCEKNTYYCTVIEFCQLKYSRNLLKNTILICFKQDNTTRYSLFFFVRMLVDVTTYFLFLLLLTREILLYHFNCMNTTTHDTVLLLSLCLGNL